MRTGLGLGACLLAASCGGAHARPASSPAPSASEHVEAIATHSIELPGGPPPIGMDYLAFDPATRTVWIPAGNSGRVDVLDTTNYTVHAIEGFATATREVRGIPRVVGPSSVTIAGDIAYVGNRGSSEVCAIDTHTFQRGACLTLPSPPDGTTFVPTTSELWITLPGQQAIAIVRADGHAPLELVATVTVEGHPEGYAVDAERGTFFTNLEDRDQTVAIDVRARRVTATWSPRCGPRGPRGLAFDPAHRWLFVACTDHVVSTDVANGGAILGSALAGGGVDAITYFAPRRLLYVGAAAIGKMRVFRVGDRGELTAIASATTAIGARNAVVDERGRAYLTDSPEGRIIVAEAPP